ncbi:Mtc6p NDAI_0C03210 [Naumovozyma dairenensis CBS 421]|uniref:Maintenance of telomere capping protein 6 n=1 Tax=Naumovozyma dairenensis (strain ATCC 10597 / BCRC 20456 / CBS 421 / NBRC 0211 / NRRL Y-12639) TaxID=1071378 RepID=G0W870_NAUDC|nr:hypothetical protein NDAI_0C03210 [Naumovozyma dairenensis CBS 421]CCD23981.1 hypothetical protein NDAI_0C03210 [Naumovozyma dairenensis CBS 421]
MNFFRVWNVLLLILLSQFQFASCQNDWAVLSNQQKIALRSQRDIMSNVTIDQLPIIGGDLRHVLFHENFIDPNITENDNTTNTRYLTTFIDLLSTGMQGFIIDIEQKNNSWVISNTSLPFGTFLNTLQIFIHTTNNNLVANMLVMFLRLPNGTIIQSTDALQRYPQLNLTYLFDQTIQSSSIYTPLDLATDRSGGNAWDTHGRSMEDGWPTFGTFIYSHRKRMIIIELTDILKSTDLPYSFNRTILHYDTKNSTFECPNTESALNDISTLHWRFLNSVFTPNDIGEYVSCGISPIISNNYSNSTIRNIAKLFQSTIWSWGPNQPIYTRIEHGTVTKNDTLQAYNCALLKYYSTNDSITWEVANCYRNERGLCRYKDRSFIWHVTEDEDTYFEFDNFKGSKCPDDYTFSLPRTPLEERALLLYLKNRTINDIDIWIDINSVSVSNCWVNGGPYATCPYQKAVSTRNFVKMLTPPSVISFALLALVFYLSILPLPIHDNRKNWRRISNKVSKSEAEGVPS